MADGFEVVDINDVSEELRISLDVLGRENTAIELRPHLSEADRKAIVSSSGTESAIGRLLMTGSERLGNYQLLTADGAPNEAHLDLALDLAGKIVRQRNIRAGYVIAAVGRPARQYLVINTDFESEHTE